MLSILIQNSRTIQAFIYVVLRKRPVWFSQFLAPLDEGFKGNCRAVGLHRLCLCVMHVSLSFTVLRLHEVDFKTIAALACCGLGRKYAETDPAGRLRWSPVLIAYSMNATRHLLMTG